MVWAHGELEELSGVELDQTCWTGIAVEYRLRDLHDADSDKGQQPAVRSAEVGNLPVGR